LIEELASEGTFFYILDEKGQAISDVELKEDSVFILGDHLGMPRTEEEFVARFEHEKISLGSISYLASQCITMLHYELDKKTCAKSKPF
jgi:tRNA (pseudouridine54-N1)-methyltransferase